MAGIFAVLFFAISAWAGERLNSKQLHLAQISLDGALWSLDEDSINNDGDSYFSADYLLDDKSSYITSHELGLEDANMTVESFIESSIETLKAKAKVFESRDCPNAYHSKNGWVCYSYGMSMTNTAILGSTVVQVAKRGDRIVTKRIHIAEPLNNQKEADILAAFESVELIP